MTSEEGMRNNDAEERRCNGTIKLNAKQSVCVCVCVVEEMMDTGIETRHRDQPTVRSLVPRTRTAEGRAV